jgi:hypothetical protein
VSLDVNRQRVEDSPTYDATTMVGLAYEHDFHSHYGEVRMLRFVGDLPPDVLAIEAIGKVTHDDYRNILISKAEAMIKPFFHAEVRSFSLSKIAMVKDWTTDTNTAGGRPEHPATRRTPLS